MGNDRAARGGCGRSTHQFTAGAAVGSVIHAVGSLEAPLRNARALVAALGAIGAEGPSDPEIPEHMHALSIMLRGELADLRTAWLEAFKAVGGRP